MKQTQLVSIFSLTLLASTHISADLASVQKTAKDNGFDASVKTEKITLHKGSIGPITTKATIGDSFSACKGTSVSGTVTSSYLIPGADKPIEIDWKSTLPLFVNDTLPLFINKVTSSDFFTSKITANMPNVSVPNLVPGFVSDLADKDISHDRYAVGSGALLYLLSRFNTMDTLIDPASSYGALKQMVAQYGLTNGLAYGLRHLDTNAGKGVGIVSAAIVAYSAYQKFNEKSAKQTVSEDASEEAATA